MNESQQEDIKNIIGNSLRIIAAVDKVPIPEHQGCFEYELTIHLKMDGKIISTDKISLPIIETE